jgi:hypothetical protein
MMAPAGNGMKGADLRGADHGSIRSISLTASFFAGVLIVFMSLVHAETEFVQSQLNFEKAIRNTSTYVIIATIVNDSTGEMHTECVSASFLLGAIHKEYDLGYDDPSIEKVIQIVLANPSHVFHFSKEAAIDNIPSFTKHAELFRSQYQDACDLVRQGKSVFLRDRDGGVRVDP